jgi:hypothetical protein
MAPSLAEYAYRGIGPPSVVLFHGVGLGDVVDDQLRRNLTREGLEHLRNH